MRVVKSNESKYEMTEMIKHLSKVFMFLNLSLTEICRIVDTYEFDLKHFGSGETIVSKDKFEERIYFVLEGECEVSRHKSDGTSIPLNSLKTGDSFGVLGVFSNLSEYPTDIRAKSDTVLVSIKKDIAHILVKFYPEIAMNVIMFLGDRVAFLNDKIATFSADTVEQKFAKFIVSESKKLNSRHFEINFKRTAETINSGRASLYRALDALTEKNYIKVENKKIYILDPEGLERYTK